MSPGTIQGAVPTRFENTQYCRGLIPTDLQENAPDSNRLAV